MLALADHLIALKFVARTGWLDRSVDPAQVESVADHSCGVALLAWACALQRQAEGATLDPMRVAMLGLVHDLAEAETGDSPPYDSAALPGADDPAARRAFLQHRHVRDDTRDAVKRKNEDASLQRLLAALPAAPKAALRELWEELKRGTSPEARFVKQVDRLETFLQSRYYLRDDPNLPMDSFRREAMETIDDALLAALRDAALAEPANVEAD